MGIGMLIVRMTRYDGIRLDTVPHWVLHEFERATVESMPPRNDDDATRAKSPSSSCGDCCRCRCCSWWKGPPLLGW